MFNTPDDLRAPGQLMCRKKFKPEFQGIAGIKINIILLKNQEKRLMISGKRLYGRIPRPSPKTKFALIWFNP